MMIDFGNNKTMAEVSRRRRERSSATISLLLFCLLLFALPMIHGQQFGGGNDGEERGNIGQQQQKSRCEEWQYECKDGACIARYDQCDGIEQCADGSDEEDCRHRHERPNTYNSYDMQNGQQNQPGSKPNGGHNIVNGKQQPTVAATNNAKTQQQQHSNNDSSSQQRQLPMRLLLIGASAFVIVAVVVHVWLKVHRRRKCAGRGVALRGYRKGESLIDDEDDLLISQAYSS